jgi:hypothetical protein
MCLLYPSHGENRGSSPLGSAIFFNDLVNILAAAFMPNQRSTKDRRHDMDREPARPEGRSIVEKLVSDFERIVAEYNAVIPLENINSDFGKKLVLHRE